MSAAVSKPHPAAILLENLAPMVGVLFLGWSVAPVMVVYWIENGLRGLETAARMLLARGPLVSTSVLPGLLRHRLESLASQGRAASSGADAPISPSEAHPDALNPSIGLAGRIGMVLFFLVHYGLFWAVHGVFVFVLFVNRGPEGAFGGFPGMGVGAGHSGLPTGQIALAGCLIAVTLAVSVLRDVFRNHSGEQASPIQFMVRAYGRVMLLHVVLIFGGFAIMALGSPTPALVLLIVLKTAAELIATRRLDAQARPA
ncbi:DUF6498-containing protein [Tautonia rosea]|uniref:DUF6498-containing protein n=1 Tax=Tautonia rosea TaxID=2728037 RepID=UPI001475C1BA|nr:DUF6498-containing protein [Tautonia rosea]